MYIPTPYFKSVPYFGDLTLDYIFVKDKSPLLFTCIANNNMYLCLCYDNRIEQKWAISPIDVEMLRKMVYDEIPICKAFKPENSLGCIVTWSPDDKREKYNMIPCEQFADGDLPDNDFYLEDEEAITYYNVVKNRLEQKEMVDSEKNISIDASQISLMLHMSFQSTTNSVFVQNGYQSVSCNQISQTVFNTLNFPHESSNVSAPPSKSNESENSREISRAA